MRFKLTTPMLATIGAVALVGALFLSFYLSTSAYRTDGAGIVLPGEASAEPVVIAPDDIVTGQPMPIEITPENVQRVIATLKRPTGYVCTTENRLFYDGQSTTLRREQMVLGDLCRTDEQNAVGATLRTTLRKGTTLYAWENGDDTYYVGNTGHFTNDSSAMMPTYETVLELPQAQITDTGLENISYEPCVRVGFEDEAYRCVYYISTVSGLLVRADFYKEDTLVRQCEISALSNTAPEKGVFLLPDGREATER